MHNIRVYSNNIRVYVDNVRVYIRVYSIDASTEKNCQKIYDL